MIFVVLGLNKLIPKGPSISLYKLSLPSHEFLLNLERKMSPSLTSLVGTFFLEHESIHGHVSSTHSGDVYGRVFLSTELLFFKQGVWKEAVGHSWTSGHTRGHTSQRYFYSDAVAFYDPFMV